MDGTRKYHPEWGNSITKEHTWYALTYKWILALKLRIPKIQLTDHMKLKIRKTKMWILWFFLEGGAKYPRVETERQSVEQRLNERSLRDCPICLPFSIVSLHPGAIVDANKGLLTRAWYSYLLRDSVSAWKYWGGCSQPTIGLITGTTMEEIEKGPKVLEGFAAP